MKVSIFSNDKTTMKDELIISAFVAVALVIGAVLVALRPSFGIVDSASTTVFGVLMLITGVIFIPGLIYRFKTNYKGGTDAK